MSKATVILLIHHHSSAKIMTELPSKRPRACLKDVCFIQHIAQKTLTLRSLSFFLSNFRSLFSKQEEPLCSINICELHVTLGSETWLCSEIHNSELLLDKDLG